MADKLTLSFHGGAREVTGACYLLESGDAKILVDCGLVQGGRFCETHNSKPFGFDPKSIDALFITHAHLDHIGRIPKLVKEGFRGPIYSTPPTKDLAELIIRDGHGIMEKEAKDCQEEVTYGVPDIDQAMTQWKTLEYHEALTVGDTAVSLLRAGHILGSSMVEVKIKDKKILFTGDLGNETSLLLPPADVVNEVDYLIIESVYGDKAHAESSDDKLILERVMEDTAAKKGVLMIPAFATERTQDVIFELNEKVVQKRVPDMPVFVDSPLAIKITEVFEKYWPYYNEKIQALHEEHPHLFASKGLKNTPSADESKAINDVPPPKVIIAGSGMMTGGRILHHLRRYLADENSMLLITGYQAKGSLGRRILDGVDSVKIFGEEIPVKAKIVTAHGYSAHADKDRLFNFAAHLKDSLAHVYAVQGEEEASLALVQEVRDKLGVPADAPTLGERVELV